MQTLSSEEEAFADEVIAGAAARSPKCFRAIASRPSCGRGTAGSAFLGCPTLLHVRLLFFCFHIHLGLLFEVYPLAVRDIAAWEHDTVQVGQKLTETHSALAETHLTCAILVALAWVSIMGNLGQQQRREYEGPGQSGLCVV